MKITYSKASDIKVLKEELSNLITTGIVDSENFCLILTKEQKEAYKDLEYNEDKAAAILLDGGKVKVIDVYADGTGYAGNDVPFKVRSDDSVAYAIDMRAIKDGLLNALNGDILNTDKESLDLAREAFRSFAEGEDSGDFDVTCGEALVQCILFNEIIYG